MESLATVAVPKLETAIEVLFAAESSSRSALRLKLAFKAFFGLNGKDRIRPDSCETVHDFVASIVRTRSRILHGTWSTLAFDPGINEDAGRQIVELLVMDLLRRTTLALDKYASYPNAVDDVEPFLKWVESDRQDEASQ
jgi:hypothetical protein